MAIVSTSKSSSASKSTGTTSSKVPSYNASFQAAKNPTTSKQPVSNLPPALASGIAAQGQASKTLAPGLSTGSSGSSGSSARSGGGGGGGGSSSSNSTSSNTSVQTPAPNYSTTTGKEVYVAPPTGNLDVSLTPTSKPQQTPFQKATSNTTYPRGQGSYQSTPTIKPAGASYQTLPGKTKPVGPASYANLTVNGVSYSFGKEEVIQTGPDKFESVIPTTVRSSGGVEQGYVLTSNVISFQNVATENKVNVNRITRQNEYYEKQNKKLESDYEKIYGNSSKESITDLLKGREERFLKERFTPDYTKKDLLSSSRNIAIEASGLLYKGLGVPADIIETGGQVFSYGIDTIPYIGPTISVVPSSISKSIGGALRLPQQLVGIGPTVIARSKTISDVGFETANKIGLENIKLGSSQFIENYKQNPVQLVSDIALLKLGVDSQLKAQAKLKEIGAPKTGEILSVREETQSRPFYANENVGAAELGKEITSLSKGLIEITYESGQKQVKPFTAEIFEKQYNPDVASKNPSLISSGKGTLTIDGKKIDIPESQLAGIRQSLRTNGVDVRVPLEGGVAPVEPVYKLLKSGEYAETYPGVRTFISNQPSPLITKYSRAGLTFEPGSKVIINFGKTSKNVNVNAGEIVDSNVKSFVNEVYVRASKNKVKIEDLDLTKLDDSLRVLKSRTEVGANKVRLNKIDIRRGRLDKGNLKPGFILTEVSALKELNPLEISKVLTDSKKSNTISVFEGKRIYKEDLIPEGYTIIGRNKVYDFTTYRTKIVKSIAPTNQIRTGSLNENININNYGTYSSTPKLLFSSGEVVNAIRSSFEVSNYNANVETLLRPNYGNVGSSFVNYKSNNFNLGKSTNFDLPTLSGSNLNFAAAFSTIGKSTSSINDSIAKSNVDLVDKFNTEDKIDFIDKLEYPSKYSLENKIEYPNKYNLENRFNDTFVPPFSVPGFFSDVGGFVGKRRKGKRSVRSFSIPKGVPLVTIGVQEISRFVTGSSTVPSTRALTKQLKDPRVAAGGEALTQELYNRVTGLSKKRRRLI